MNKIRRYFGLLTIVCLSVILTMAVSAANVSDSLTDDNTSDVAVAFTMGDTLNGSITETDKLDYFQFELGTQGKITLKMTSYMEYYCIKLMDSNGEQIWFTDNNKWTETVSFRIDTYDIDLEAGKYYIQINGDNHADIHYWDWDLVRSTGTYVCETSFVSANATNKENDNTTANAGELALGNTTVGQISINDVLDYYTLNIPSDGKLTLDMTSYMKYYCIKLLDSNGKQIWFTDGNKWTETVGYRTDVHSLDLDAGKYYMQINGDNHADIDYWNWDLVRTTGKYVCKTSFVFAGSSFSGDDNTIATAHPISFGQTYTGQISQTDDMDTYQFTAGVEPISIEIVSYMRFYCMKIYDSVGKQVWYTDGNEWNGDVGYRKDIHEITLTAGTYYLQVNGYKRETSDKSTGKYEFKVGVSVPQQSEFPEEPDDDVTQSKPLKPTGVIQMSTNNLVMKKGQTTTALKVKKMASGDWVASVKSSNKKIVKVVSASANGAIKLKALKTGSTKITVTLAGGKKAVVKVKVQAKTVKTTGIKGISRSLSLKKGKTCKLKPQIVPLTSQQKVTYRSQNRKVASVSANGKITAKKKGTAVIVVKSGSKQVKCKVTVR